MTKLTFFDKKVYKMSSGWSCIYKQTASGTITGHQPVL